MLWDGRSIVLKAHKSVGESPRCVYTEETHQPPRVYFPRFSADTGGYCDHSSSLSPTATGPALLSSLPSLTSRGEDEAVAAQLGSMQLLL